MRRGRKAIDQLPLLRRMAGGDIVLPEVVVNRVLAKAGLDEELPMHWETLAVRFYDGYFELDLQGAVKFIRGPVFRIQARFESVEVSLKRQVVRIRLLREIQTFSHGVVERMLLLMVQAIFGRLFAPEALLKVAHNSGDAFTQEAPDLLRIDLHEIEPVKRQLDKKTVTAIGALLGQDTVLIHAMDCRKGELIIRTTTVAQEMARKGLKIGVVAGSAASRVANVLGEVGRAVADDVREVGRAVAGDVREVGRAIADDVRQNLANPDPRELAPELSAPSPEDDGGGDERERDEET